MARMLVEVGQKHRIEYDDAIRRNVGTFTIDDQFYRDGSGLWAPVSEVMVPDAGGYDRKCDTVRHLFRLASGGNRLWAPRRNIPGEYATITAMDYYTNRWRTLNLPAAAWKSDGAEWDMANLYASITNNWHSVKTVFVLKDASAPTGLRFAMTLTGLTMTNWRLYSGGLEVGSLVPPIAWDANGAPVPVNATWDGTWVTWTVDPTGHAFPITIDPTFTDGYQGDVDTAKDTYVEVSVPDNNHGSQEVMLCHVAGGSYTARALVQFDLSSISDTATCTSATFYNYLARVVDYNCSFAAHSILSGNSGWVEGNQNANTESGTACWNYKAWNTTGWAGSAGLNTADTDFGSASIGTWSRNTSEAIGSEVQVALTASVVEAWFGASNTNYGILLRETTDAWPSHNIASSDNGTTGYRPKLVVVYSTGAPVLTAVQHTNHIDLSWV